MRRLLRLVCAGFLAALVCTSLVAGETVTILHLNDTHAHLLPYGPKDAAGDGTWGGYARIATAVGMTRMTDPNVMFLHAGDFTVGDFMFQKYLGIPELEILKQLGCDALELGNHEFDLYPSTLKYMLSEAGFPGDGFPVLGANLDMTADPEMAYFVQPYTIKQYGDVKVGIFGLLTDLTNVVANPQPDVVMPPLDVAQMWVDSLRNDYGCDVVLLLSHLGYAMDQAVAMSTSGIDVIVGGHSHTLLTQPVQIGSTLILQAGESGNHLGKLSLDVESGAITGWSYQSIPIDTSIPAEPTVNGLLQGLAAELEADPRFGPVYTEPVATAAFDLGRLLGPGLRKDNPTGNLMADAFRNITGTDIAFQPQGFISQQFWAGPVRGAEIFQAAAYGFDPVTGMGMSLITFETDGASLMAGLEFAVYNLPYVEDFVMQSANISYAYNSSLPPGGRVDYSSIMIGGAPINPYATYSVTAPDGVVPFLTQIPGFTVSNVQPTGVYQYTGLRDYMAAHSPVVSYREGRVLDLATLADPMAGLGEVADMITTFTEEGAIQTEELTSHLYHELDIVNKHMENERTTPAMAKLNAMSQQVNDRMAEGEITASAAHTLTYVLGKLGESIAASTMAAAKTDGAAVPGTFELMQNYPNPFNPTTTIAFILPSEGPVKLEVFNILGEKVATLLDGVQSAGVHRVTWDATPYAAGLYLYRVSTGDASWTKKMLLLK